MGPARRNMRECPIRRWRVSSGGFMSMAFSGGRTLGLIFRKCLKIQKAENRSTVWKTPGREKTDRQTDLLSNHPLVLQDGRPLHLLEHYCQQPYC